MLDFSNSWRFVEAHEAGYCRRKLLLELLENQIHQPVRLVVAMYVYNIKQHQGGKMQSFNDELKILVDALGQLGQKGEVKVAEWIRGSSAP